MVMMVLRSRAESYRDQKSRERPCVTMMMVEPDFSSLRALFHALGSLDRLLTAATHVM